MSCEVLEKDGKKLSGSGSQVWIRKMVDQGTTSKGDEKGAGEEWKVDWFRTYQRLIFVIRRGKNGTCHY